MAKAAQTTKHGPGKVGVYDRPARADRARTIRKAAIVVVVLLALIAVAFLFAAWAEAGGSVRSSELAEAVSATLPAWAAGGPRSRCNEMG